MNKLITLVTAIVLAASANVALAMDGQADRFNEARSYPDKTVEVAQRADNDSK
ncbi:hypothetical protein ABIE59_001948 [Marinobacter sp. MBR-99]|uniref:hypothetical protein n=1 Tax=Marinobacter sp. MBR-99 TaxID=3156461 RepID=UPI0033970DAF